VADLNTFFVGARVLVQVPVGTRTVLAVPEAAVSTRAGLDFVTLALPGGPREVSVVPGSRLTLDGGPAVEILSGLRAGDRVIVP